MINFFSDIDNTLIYSYRKRLPYDKIAVEWISGRGQSFMTEKSFKFLSQTEIFNIIPVTTRTKEQYFRLSFMTRALRCRYALVCNGGILLKDGITDGLWLEETYDMTSNERKALKEARSFLTLFRVDIHDVEGLMVYAKVPNPEYVAGVLKKSVNISEISVFFDNRKVYCIPKSMNKGGALMRFSKYRNCQLDIAAGDGIQDISMLEAVKNPIIPEKLGRYVVNANKYMVDDGEIFSDAICRYLGIKYNLRI